MKRLTLIMILSSLTFGMFAQDFEVPQNYKLEKADDYAGYETDVINCFNWLMNTPINEEARKRKDAEDFLLLWIFGNPKIRVEMNFSIVPSPEYPDLMTIFMGGWTKYSLESNDFDDKVAGNTAGIKAVIEFYLKNKEYLGKIYAVEKYIKMKEKGKLEDFIKNNV